MFNNFLLQQGSWMQSLGVLETRLLTYWTDILYNLNAIYKTICVFDTNKMRLATKTVIQIFVLC